MKTSVASHRTLIEHWNGRRWRIVKSPNMGTRGNALYSVVATSGSNAWAAGISGWSANSSIPTATLVEWWNGTSWHVQPSADLGTGSNWLSGVDASSSTNAWGVGNYSTVQSGGEVRPLAVHCC